MSNKLKELLSRNEVSTQSFQETVYQNLKLSIFEVVCRVLEDKALELTVRSRLRNSRSQVLFIKEFIQEICGCQLSDEESNEILNLLTAYFNKRDTRKVYSEVLRHRLLAEQKFECNICSTSIKLSTSELDHIIPWTYVGDELDNNLQMLCTECNRRKGKSIHFHLKMFLINNR